MHPNLVCPSRFRSSLNQGIIAISRFNKALDDPQDGESWLTLLLIYNRTMMVTHVGAQGQVNGISSQGGFPVTSAWYALATWLPWNWVFK